MHGAEDDVRELGAHLAAYLNRATTPVQAAASRRVDEAHVAVAVRAALRWDMNWQEIGPGT